MRRVVAGAMTLTALSALGLAVAAPADAAPRQTCAQRGFTDPYSNWKLTQEQRDGSTVARGNIAVYWSASRMNVCVMAYSPNGGADGIAVKVRRAGDDNWNDTDGPASYSQYAGGVVSRDFAQRHEGCVRIEAFAFYPSSADGKPAGTYSLGLRSIAKFRWDAPGQLC